MMINNLAKKLSIAAGLALSSSVMFADTVTVPGASTSSIWQNWSAGNGGSAYWNNVSWDGANKNIGNCLTSSNCGMTQTPGALPYLGQSNGKAFTNFYFSGTGSPVTATLEAQLAADAPYDYMGWYNVQNPTQFGIIFSPTSGIGSTTTFDPTAQYGLFFANVAPTVNDSFMSQSTSSLSSDSGNQHFAVFEGSAGTYYVGAEDLPSGKTDFDYNDMVVKMSTATAAPEPSELLLFAVGLTAVGTFRFRRQAKAKKA